jgi:hypothetical protein
VTSMKEGDEERKRRKEIIWILVITEKEDQKGSEHWTVGKHLVSSGRQENLTPSNLHQPNSCFLLLPYRDTELLYNQSYLYHHKFMLLVSYLFHFCWEWFQAFCGLFKTLYPIIWLLIVRRWPC